MKNETKTKEQLLKELAVLRQEIAELKGSASDRKRREEESQKVTSHKILIVDDDPIILNLLTEILKNSGYQALNASSGQIALRSVITEVPDLILLDVIMPDMDGYRVCQHLKSNEQSRMIPVIFISALGEATDKVKGFNAGGVDFITKPFQSAEVLARVKTHLDLRRLQKQLEMQNAQLQEEIKIREQAEAALLESERRLYDIIEFLPDATFAINREGKVITWNQAIEEMTGVKAKDMVGKGNYEYALPFYGTRRPMLIDLVLSPDEEIEKKYKIFKRQGRILRGETTVTLKEEDLMVWGKASPLYDNRGNIVGSIQNIRDITEQTQTEEFLRHAEAEYRSIFENAQEGIFRATSEGKFIIANQALASMLNYSSPKDLMKTITDIPHQLYVNLEDYETLKQMIKEYGPIKGFETQFYQSDGKPLWISINMNTIYDTDGQMLYEEGIVEDISARKKVDEERKLSMKRLRNALGATVQAMAAVVETRDPYTAGHQRRVSDLARAIATEMSLSRNRIDGIRVMGTIHDIGKISVPAEILSKPTKLTDMEFGLIKAHSHAGFDILKEIEFPWPVAEIVLQHHEKLNGSGYPQGLKGDKILPEAKIICVADVVEAMASHRPYRAALGIETALEEISKNRGILYDPDVVDVCLNLFRVKGYKLVG